VNNASWKEHLHWDHNIPSVLMFDEAQLTYGDVGLWDAFFKPVSDFPSHRYHRIIIFASYGSLTRINARVTTMLIKPSQMVTLAPIDHHDGLKPVGLYLTRPEFDEIVDLLKCSLDPECLDYIFKISSGHVGAMTDVIYIISCDDVSLPRILTDY
jgi:hypothetical protein